MRRKPAGTPVTSYVAGTLVHPPVYPRACDTLAHHGAHAGLAVSFAGLPSVARRITGFHQDDDGQWVAELECGHGQHVRHDPPWQNRPWTQTEHGRGAFLGTTLGCVKCAETP